MFSRLDAEFAMLIYDAKTDELIAARDPIGIRPLFYGYWPTGAMAFASEAKNLVGLCGEIRPFPPGHYWADGKFTRYTDLTDVDRYYRRRSGRPCAKNPQLLIWPWTNGWTPTRLWAFCSPADWTPAWCAPYRAVVLGRHVRTFAIGMDTDAIDLKYAREAADSSAPSTPRYT
jgi:asparagine synthase (glutamine-hydrolysing)